MAGRYPVSAAGAVTPPLVVVPAARVVAAVADRFGVAEGALRGRDRTRLVASARHAGMYLCRTLSGLSLPAIGAEFGGRDHSTVLNGIRQVQLYRAQDETWRTLLTDLAGQLRAWERTATGVPAAPAAPPAAAPEVLVLVLECPVCLLDGAEFTDVVEAVQLAGVHDDLRHRGAPTSIVRPAAGGAR